MPNSWLPIVNLFALSFAKARRRPLSGRRVWPVTLDLAPWFLDVPWKPKAEGRAMGNRLKFHGVRDMRIL